MQVADCRFNQMRRVLSTGVPSVNYVDSVNIRKKSNALIGRYYILRGGNILLLEAVYSRLWALHLTIPANCICSQADKG